MPQEYGHAGLEGSSAAAAARGRRRGVDIHDARDPRQSAEARFAAHLAGSSPKREAVEARVFFRRLLGEGASHPQLQGGVLGDWYDRYGPERLSALWDEAMTNQRPQQAKVPLWYWADALRGRFVPRAVLGKSVERAREALPEVREGDVVRLPDGYEGEVDCVTNGGRFCMVIGRNESTRTSDVVIVRREAVAAK